MIGRVEREKRTVELMIRIYCKRKEGNSELCNSCTELLEYAIKRLSACGFGDEKHACKHCPHHCYKPEMRNRIREVMRFSGVRMLIYSPIEALRHLFMR
ncbi:MAG: nitrous oxide-stimulated promoter family protein [Rikenellaceae bacterium]